MKQRFDVPQSAIIGGRKATTATRRKVEVDHTPPRLFAMPNAGSARWCVATSEPRCEMRAFASLVEEGYPAFIPMTTKWRRKGYKQDKRAYPLFPGYLFVALVSGPSKAIRRCDAISSIVSDRDGPLFVRADMIRALSDSMMAGAFDETLTPEDRFKVGDKVCIEAGPFMSIAGQIASLADGDRVKVMVNMLGAMREAIVDADHLRKIA